MGCERRQRMKSAGENQVSIKASGWGRILWTAGPCNRCVLLVSSYMYPLPGTSDSYPGQSMGQDLGRLSSIRQPSYIRKASAPHWEQWPDPTHCLFLKSTLLDRKPQTLTIVIQRAQ